MENFEKTKNWVKNSITLKLAIISILALLMLIPANMIRNLIQERERTRDTVISEISDTWGNGQTIAGPVLSLPYKYVVIVNDKPKEMIDYVHVLPDNLDISGEIFPDTRYRGIYKVIVYQSKLSFKGKFKPVDMEKLKISGQDILWDEAFLSIGIPDMKGINDKIEIKWNNESLLGEPGIKVKDVISSGVSCDLSIEPEKENNFSFIIDINGTEYLNFYPLGKETIVDLKSTWANPSFSGSFLPDERTISPEGFSAHWKVLHLNRNYPQQWTGKSYQIQGSDFGVILLMPVDQYLKSLRSVKYAIMFIALTFIIFFFIEVLTKNKVHPVQYLLVGIALCVFYSLLISLAEHIGFNLAYLISGLAIIIMIFLYSLSVFKEKKHAVVMGIVLTLLYVFLFTVLQLADYALVLGNIGLFVVLGLIMLYSRKIDLYRQE